jgi:hypothetical protein
MRIATHSLAGIVQRKESAGDDEWEDEGLDSDLARLVHGGATVDASTVAEILAAIQKPAFTGGEIEAADLLIVAAQSAPAEVLKQQGALDALDYETGLSQEFDSRLRHRVLAALGRADAAAAHASARDEPCWRQLATRVDADAWQRGAYCAFFIALNDRPVLAPMQKRLQSWLQGGVAERLAARTTLEMLATAQRVHEAHAKPALIALARAQLRYELRDIEPHISIAARAGLLSLREGEP